MTAPTAPPPIPAATPIHGAETAPDGRRVVRMGMVEDGADPVLRQHGDAHQGPSAMDRVEDESEYDIPTFLRKQSQ